MFATHHLQNCVHDDGGTFDRGRNRLVCLLPSEVPESTHKTVRSRQQRGSTRKPGGSRIRSQMSTVPGSAHTCGMLRGYWPNPLTQLGRKPRRTYARALVSTISREVPPLRIPVTQWKSSQDNVRAGTVPRRASGHGQGPSKRHVGSACVSIPLLLAASPFLGRFSTRPPLPVSRRYRQTVQHRCGAAVGIRAKQ